MPEPSASSWFKSSYSGGSGTECLECARTEDGALVRDSKTYGGPTVMVRGRAWRVFTEALRKGELEGQGLIPERGHRDHAPSDNVRDAAIARSHLIGARYSGTT